MNVDNWSTSGARNYCEAVQQCIDLLIEHGTDRYGDTYTPILVSILDVQSLSCPADPLPLDEHWRVQRRGRRAPAGANLLMDQPTLSAMFQLSALTEKPRYAEFARKYIDWYLTHLVDDKGFWWWGWHRHYDVFRDCRDGHDGNPHEFHAMHTILWEKLWEVNPESVRREIEAIWKWHVIDKETGEVNRHDDGGRGCDFSMTSAAFGRAFAFMYSRTGERVWQTRARLLADYFWRRRHEVTNLIAARPNAGSQRFDGSHFTTAEVGLCCRDLLHAYEFCGDEELRNYALAYLRAYAKYGYDKQTGRFWGALRLDGSPEPGPRVVADVRTEAGYHACEPRGHLDLWQPYVAGYEHPLASAEVYALAYTITGEKDLLKTARQFAEWILIESPPRSCLSRTWYEGYARDFAPQGTYAEHYGRAIAFLVRLHRCTGEKRYAQAAFELAADAITKLQHNGLFRGHPAKPYYEATDGVGFLLEALLQADALSKEERKNDVAPG
ncbi:MAG: hypothetical protein KKG09_05850 [Verrucomicrobia bacterium]|nr:hypothetical protein [Verrucomicrobiota bacterium]MCG2681051.1 hypothetical protein [Kiritimatiellia bacterium]MBU4248035.1 hypothetical protein [Verrucomicrobiota bacterium]MBU4291976.1 hypothetical protein [Verrucomicrobiota bacterium]MBU4430269.1 hypothetical protein [Verrucomicrobiota bacterium]